MRNLLKTAVLMAAITALFVALGGLLGGRQGMLLALEFAAAGNVFSYWFSDALVLRMYDAREVDARSAPEFYGIVHELVQRAGMPMPRVYLIDEAAPNAFATGRGPRHAAVAATSGLLGALDARGLRAVMAHELSHVRHRDILISTVGATMAGAIAALANFALLFGSRDSEGRGANPIAAIALAVLAPLAAGLIQMAISRAREFEADRGAAELTGDPVALAAALRRIEALAQHGAPFAIAEEHPATAQMMIVNPLHGNAIARLFSTHPSTDERVAALMRIAAAHAR